MDLTRESEFPADLSPLAWVQEELRRTLESVHKALRRVLRDTDARSTTLGGDGQPSPALQGAAQQMHQAAGVLSVVSLPAAAHLLRAAEATLFRLAENPAGVTIAEVEAVERADFAVLAFIAKTLAGGQPSSLALFPAYQTLQELNGAGRIHPADLWTEEFRWRELPLDRNVRALTPEQMRAPFEALLLKQMRSPAPGQGKLLSDLCAGLALTQSQPNARTLWMLAAGQFEAQSRGLLPVDTLVKRLGSRLLAQLRAGSDAAPSERLAKDLLFFCAAAKHAEPGAAPRLDAVQQAYGLVEPAEVDYRDDTLGRIDPNWVAAAKKRVAAAKESWASAAEGETHRLGGLDEQFAHVAESLHKLFPSGEVLGDTLRRAVVTTLRSGRAPEPALAMEIATSMLYLEAALEDEAFDQPEQGERVKSLARRIESVGHGDAPLALEHWMEELYRRVADRQTLGSVVHELRASLSEVERQCDEYFRDPAKRDLLIPVPGQLQAMRGVFSVLGLSQAAQATLRMRDQVDELANTEVDPSLAGPRAQFDRLAHNLGALGFLIDMLSVQPQLAKRMFRFEEDTGLLQSLVGRESEQRAHAQELAAAEAAAHPQLLDQLQATAQAVAQGERPAEELARDLERISHEARAADDLGLAQAAQQAQQQLLSAGDAAAGSHAAESLQQFIEAAAPVAPPAPAPSAPIPQAEEAIDEEMLGIFLEEAAEVVSTARDALAALARNAGDKEQLTTVRRAFHTLKGSSRMVGLNEFGEAGWACEQLYNHRLSEHPQADSDLLRFSNEALDAFQAWAAAIGEGRPHGFHSAPFRAAADALRLENRYTPLAVSAEPVEAPAAPVAELPELIEVAEIVDLAPSADAPEVIELSEVPEVHEIPVAETAHEVDLSGLSVLPELSLADEVAAPAPSADEQAALDLLATLDAEPATAASALPSLDLPALDLPGLDVPPLPVADLGVVTAIDAGAPDALSLEFPGAMPELTQAVPELVSSVDLDALSAADLPAMTAEPPVLDTTMSLPTVADVVDASTLLEPVTPEAPAAVEPPAFHEEPTHLLEPTLTQADEVTATMELPAGWPEDAPLVEIEATTPMPLDDLPVEPAAEAPSLDLLDLSDLNTGPVAAIDPASMPDLSLTLDLGEELVAAPATDVAPEAPAADASFPDEATLDLSDLGDLREPESATPPEGLSPRSLTDLDLPDLNLDAPAEPVPHAPPALSLVGGTAVPAPLAEDLVEDLSAEDNDDGVKVIGPLRISIALFNIFLNEADERSRRLQVELSEWSLLPQSPLPQDAEALAHGLAGSAATVGFDDLSTLARCLEHALGRAQGHEVADPTLFQRAADEIRRLLHQFAAGFLKEADAGLLAELQAFEPGAALPDGHADSDEGLLAMSLEEVSTSALPPGLLDLPVAPVAPVAPGLPATAASFHQAAEASADDFDFSQPDQIEPELMPIFEEEAEDLLGELHGALREWAAQPADTSRAAACMRVLHTFKGGARLAGAMRLGEEAHRLESQIERLVGDGEPRYEQLVALQDAGDGLEHSFKTLQRTWRDPAPVVPAPMAPSAPAAPIADLPAPIPATEAVETVQAPAEGSDAIPAPAGDAVAEQEAAQAAEAAELVEPVEPVEPVVEPVAEPVAEAPVEAPVAAAEPEAVVEAPVAEPVVAAPPRDLEIDWAHFSEVAELGQPLESAPVAPAAQVRVRGVLLERMAALSGEVSIRRARLESEMGQMRTSLSDLDDNLERLRTQLRELELQAEARIAARQEAAQASGKDFDPLEFDRYTRFQELTRMLAESVNDVATVQRGLQRNVAAGEDELAAQSRLTRELQDDLLRTRMVEFDSSMAERLHRVVRQAARESGKQAQLEIRGGGVELDRAVLERLTGAFEHLLRNSVVHGIETPEVRQQAGKAPAGRIVLNLHQEGNEIQVRFSDDGAGLNLARIRARGESQGLIQPGQDLTDAQLMDLVFEPGFSTAESLTEMAGRGVGMDVVRSEVNTLGGYVLTESTAGQGASFELRVPLTTALTQVVVLRYGDRKVAVPASLMLSVQRLSVDQVEQAYADGALMAAGERMPFYWLGGLMHHSDRGVPHGKTMPVALVHSAQQRLALHVDEVLGNQEVVIKNLGPQLMQVPGLAGISLLASGDVALIYNPVALANRYGHAAQQRVHDADAARQVVVEEAAQALPPLVMVVDDSLTVRRVTQRLLEREGYRVLLAKDGLDAMERLGGDELPAVVLSDIEMPRMDGFDLVRNLRADTRLAGLPVIMITSRIAQKHRDYAQQLGVDDYLGKPYDEEHLLGLIARYTSHHSAGQPARA
ncbi:Hpt domain-containing protein [Mitsuaria sp. GD03876]|uniref:hybrid sensor histidine kinase/response regulator n=1 Tax=Mitsuaria sp. GD03876 TaxID=2975399 RepID=UPI0024482229|nr:Hpt domain-containing protein [Mitsuaria sp. GD03876]MDH0867168.1 Hpt domain-containing protein [Mitsuaria sp. GD03876]